MISVGFDAKFKVPDLLLRCGVLFSGSAFSPRGFEKFPNQWTDRDRPIEERLVNNGVAAAVYDADRCAVVIDAHHGQKCSAKERPNRICAERGTAVFRHF